MGYATVTAIGNDRVGIVDDISGFLAELELNIEESRMALLGGEFAGIVLVSGTESAIHRLVTDAEAFGNRSALTIRVVPTVQSHHEPSDRPYLLSAYSLDTPGLVHAVSAVLRGLAVNIEDLESEVTAAPWTGAPMFTMRARIVVGKAVPISRVKDALADLEEERDLDIRLDPISTAG
jgi:glycine cleavage system transcriptional repressor